MKEKIVFFGAGPYVESVIETLGKEFDLVKVVSSKEEFTDELINQLKSSGAKVAVLASFGQIIPESVLNLFEFGIINIHPSLLPKFRGPTPVQSAILAGETTTGVCLMKLDAEIDHGPILVSIDQSIDSFDTAESLYKKLFEIGANALVEFLPKYISGELKPVEQNHDLATYTEHLDRQSGFIDLNHESEITNHGELERMVRAYYPWPGVWFKYNLNGVEKTIKLLPGEKIQVEGKNVMTFKDFINGYSEGKEILEKLELN